MRATYPTHVIQATVTVKTEDGERTRAVPTFLVGFPTQGILSRAAAETLAKQIVDPFERYEVHAAAIEADEPDEEAAQPEVFGNIKCISGLQGKVIAHIQVRPDEAYMVIKRDQIGEPCAYSTHRVFHKPGREPYAESGRYDMSYREAVRDMIDRAGFKNEEV